MKDHSILGIWTKLIVFQSYSFCNRNGRLNATEMTADTKND